MLSKRRGGDLNLHVDPICRIRTDCLRCKYTAATRNKKKQLKTRISNTYIQHTYLSKTLPLNHLRRQCATYPIIANVSAYAQRTYAFAYRTFPWSFCRRHSNIYTLLDDATCVSSTIALINGTPHSTHPSPSIVN
jgi:hypothetical protein